MSADGAQLGKEIPLFTWGDIPSTALPPRNFKVLHNRVVRGLILASVMPDKRISAPRNPAEEYGIEGASRLKELQMKGFAFKWRDI